MGRFIIFMKAGRQQCAIPRIITNRMTNNSTAEVSIIGAGVAGLTCACELVDRGISVSVYERALALGAEACSWYAGGMLAPWCERESAEQEVVDLGQRAKVWWKNHTETVVEKGSLVLSPKRDLNELQRFSKLTENHRWVNAGQIRELEQDLGGSFEKGLFFEQEAHLDPRHALQDLVEYLNAKGVEIHYGDQVSSADLGSDFVIDCRGFTARDSLPGLRGVKGEMLVLRSDDIELSRPIRLLHPRYPMYVVPRGDGRFMIGATMIENDDRNRISALSMLELLSAAYALHSGFGEAEIIETGVDVRPAFLNNLPALSRKDNVIFVNGLFRHGFLLGPAMAIQVADALTDCQAYEGLPLCA